MSNVTNAVPRPSLGSGGGSAPTACLWIALGPNEAMFIYREHYEKNKNVPENTRMIIAASGDEQYVQTFMDPHAVDKPPAYYGMRFTPKTGAITCGRKVVETEMVGPI